MNCMENVIKSIIINAMNDVFSRPGLSNQLPSSNLVVRGYVSTPSSFIDANNVGQSCQLLIRIMQRLESSSQGHNDENNHADVGQNYQIGDKNLAN